MSAIVTPQFLANVFTATPEQYDEFLQLLDTPIETTKLAALLREESPFGKTTGAPASRCIDALRADATDLANTPTETPEEQA